MTVSISEEALMIKVFVEERDAISKKIQDLNAFSLSLYREFIEKLSRISSEQISLASKTEILDESIKNLLEKHIYNDPTSYKGSGTRRPKRPQPQQPQYPQYPQYPQQIPMPAYFQPVQYPQQPQPQYHQQPQPQYPQQMAPQYPPQYTQSMNHKQQYQEQQRQTNFNPFLFEESMSTELRSPPPPPPSETSEGVDPPPKAP